MKGYRATDFPALAVGKVRYAGEAVAVVVGESRYAAEDAAELISVSWEPLPVVVGAEAGAAAGRPLVHEEAGSHVLLSRAFVQGDAEAALRSAAVVAVDRVRFPPH